MLDGITNAANGVYEMKPYTPGERLTPSEAREIAAWIETETLALVRIHNPAEMGRRSYALHQAGRRLRYFLESLYRQDRQTVEVLATIYEQDKPTQREKWVFYE